MSLAIFDLDDTLLAGDSDHAWGEFMIEEGLVSATSYRLENELFFKAYKEGGLDIDAYLRFVLRPLKGMERERLQSLQNDFLKRYVEPMITKGGLACLARHRQNGERLLIITATNELITAPIARRLGVDDLLASQAGMRDGKPSGEPEGIPCFQEGKVKRLKAWIAEEGLSLEGSTFYSDSHNDIPLLEFVEHPVAVDADESLRIYAARKGWEQISFRP